MFKFTDSAPGRTLREALRRIRPERILPAAAAVLLLAACGSERQSAGAGPEFPEQPSRAAHEGFSWVEVSGAGLRLWAQQNDNLRIVPDETLPGLRMKRRDADGPETPVVRIFHLPNQKIEDVLDQLRQESGWDEGQTCRFREGKSRRKGVRRYDLVPTDAYAERLAALYPKEPVPSTCNGWGMGNSGTRYFEIHDNRLDRALFLEIGQEAPLFDEQSIVFDEDADSVMLLRGRVVMAHEVRSFVPEGDTVEYWIVDRSGALEREYDRVTGGQKNGSPAEAELKVRYKGPSDEGFAAEYEGVFEVVELVSIGKAEE